MVKAAEDTIPDLVSCGRMQSFWVGWKDGLVQVGRGQFPKDILLQVRQDNTN